MALCPLCDPSVTCLLGKSSISLIPGGAELSTQAGAGCQGVVQDGQVFLHAGVSGQLCCLQPSQHGSARV